MKMLALLTAAVVAGALAAEVTMEPTSGDRAAILILFVVTALVVALVARRLPGWSRRMNHVRHAVMAVSLAGVVVIISVLAASAWLMFLSPHDLRLVLLVLGFGMVIATVFALEVARPLTGDLERIAAIAREMGEGDLTVATGIDRPDEVGAVAAALDEATARLAWMEEERRRDHEARQAFLTAIGHDLRTPLSALRAAVEAVSDGVARDPARYLRSMEHDIEALTRLVDDLFLLTRIEAGDFDLQMVTFDLSDLADEVLETLRPVASRHGVELVLETAGHMPIAGGPEALSRVIRNLVDNAIRHSPESGTVVVRVEDDGTPVVRVIDDGPGFEPGFVERAFESFTRDDEARTRATGGAGLGLAIAHGFVTAHGGTIWAEPGPGGRVGFRLPGRAAA
jgi:two-component system sensor histidine kinase BaeS